jgi:hypothetical protein
MGEDETAAFVAKLAEAAGLTEAHLNEAVERLLSSSTVITITDDSGPRFVELGDFYRPPEDKGA